MFDEKNPSRAIRWLWRLPGVGRPLTVAVDVARMRPGGENGGIKPYLLSLFVHSRRAYSPLRLFWLCSSGMASEFLPLLAPGDRIFVVDRDGTFAPCDQRIVDSPALSATELRARGTHVVYGAFGVSRFCGPDLPLVSLIVDTLHRDLPEMLPPAEVAYRDQWFNDALTFAGAVHCLSGYVERQLQHHFPTARGRTFVLPPLPTRPASGGRTKLAGTRPFFFYPANFWPHKNHEALLLAFRHYRATATGEAWELTLTGFPDERMRQLQQIAATLRIDHHVHFRGHLCAAEFTELWRQAGALVFPSLYEGLGLPLIEAMAENLPIIAGPYASIAEIAGSAALSADMRRPAELAGAMQRVASDANLRSRLTEAGAARFAHYRRSAGAEAARFVALLRSIAGS